MYTNQVEIPPLLMKDDTLAVSECGYKTIRMNNVLNTQTNVMGLQCGTDECVKLHIGKTFEKNLCIECKVDEWKDEIMKHEDGHEEIHDVYVEKEVMKTVESKKYLGSKISTDI